MITLMVLLKNIFFIMTFIKKGWGQDIAALSNMAESLVNISIKYNKEKVKLRPL